MGFMSPNLERRGRLVRFWIGLFFLAVALVSWLAIGLPWLTLLATLSTLICWFQCFRGWCFFRACRLKSIE